MDINWKDFDHEFKPLKNHIDKHASFEGIMFETYGLERDFVLEQYRINPLTIWTIIEGDNGDSFLQSGFHYVNRLGYIITKNPSKPNQKLCYRL
jgi:hypothetical protein